MNVFVSIIFVIILLLIVIFFAYNVIQFVRDIRKHIAKKKEKQKQEEDTKDSK